jgi:hypothetical protein
MRDDANPYESPLTLGTEPEPADDAGKPFSNRVAKVSCYATLAAILLFAGSFASFTSWHPRRGTYAPAPVYAELCCFTYYVCTWLAFLTSLVALVSGIIGIILGLRRGTIRSVLFAAVAVLLNGGWLAAFIVYCYCARRHSV